MVTSSSNMLMYIWEQVNIPANNIRELGEEQVSNLLSKWESPPLTTVILLQHLPKEEVGVCGWLSKSVAEYSLFPVSNQWIVSINNDCVYFWHQTLTNLNQGGHVYHRQHKKKDIA